MFWNLSYILQVHDYLHINFSWEKLFQSCIFHEDQKESNEIRDTLSTKGSFYIYWGFFPFFNKTLLYSFIVNTERKFVYTFALWRTWPKSHKKESVTKNWPLLFSLESLAKLNLRKGQRWREHSTLFLLHLVSTRLGPHGALGEKFNCILAHMTIIGSLSKLLHFENIILCAAEKTKFDAFS